MQDVNSIQQFEKLKHTLEEESKQIKKLEDDMRRKEGDYKRAKETFEKLDREMEVLKKAKQDLVLRRGVLENEFRVIQKQIEDMNKRAKMTLKS